MSEKESAQELAVFGGPPAFAEALHVGRPNIPNRERLFERLTAILDRRILTNNGPCVREFEEKLAEMLGVRHCVAVCNATIALQLAVRALRLSGEVILPSFTFVATAHALAWEGVTPVFCDVDRRTHTLDPRQVESLITERTTAILGVHIWGRPCDIPALTKLADNHKLSLFFDAAHAVGCSFQGKMLGGFGKVEVLSFHATKVLNCFEGGALTTNDDALAAELRLARNFGFAGVDRVQTLGINGKMSEISAAMGLTSLESFPNVCSRNRSNYELYQELLANVPGIAFCAYDDSEWHNHHYIIVECEAGLETLSRDELMSAATGKRAGEAILLSGLPSNGALPVDVSLGDFPPAEHASIGRSGVGLAQRRFGVRRRHPQRLCDFATRAGERRRGPPLAARFASERSTIRSLAEKRLAIRPQSLKILVFGPGRALVPVAATRSAASPSTRKKAVIPGCRFSMRVV